MLLLIILLGYSLAQSNSINSIEIRCSFRKKSFVTRKVCDWEMNISARLHEEPISTQAIISLKPFMDFAFGYVQESLGIYMIMTSLLNEMHSYASKYDYKSLLVAEVNSCTWICAMQYHPHLSPMLLVDRSEANAESLRDCCAIPRADVDSPVKIDALLLGRPRAIRSAYLGCVKDGGMVLGSEFFSGLDTLKLVGQAEIFIGLYESFWWYNEPGYN